jgi:3-oxoadipate enol-lactonase
VRGAKIDWSESGTGPTVVYAHGLTSSRASDAKAPFDWSPVAASARRLVAYDARGHGHSSGDADPRPYHWSALALDLLELIDELSPEDPVGAIGCSMGTGTLLHTVLQAPERFERLVLTAPPTAWTTRVEQAERYRAGADLADVRGVPALLQVLTSMPIPAILSEFPDFPPPPDVSDALLPLVLRGAADSDLPERSAIAGIDIPVLLLAWAGDAGHPVSTAEQLLSLLPRAQLMVAETPSDLRQWGKLSASFLTG